MTGIEQETTAGSDQDKTENSIAVVLWAADRTLLAWVRTSLSMIGFGFIIHQAAIFLHQEGVLDFSSRIFGLGLWIIGVIILIFASLESFYLRRQLLRNEALDVLRMPLALIVAMVICVIGVMGLIGFLIAQMS